MLLLKVRLVSEHIAVEMVAIDGQHNGWRHLVLPIAHTETLVLSAVLTAASFHLASQSHCRSSKYLSLEKPLPFTSTAPTALQAVSHACPEPTQIYIRTIMDLQARHLESISQTAKHSTLLTILTLLVAVMVTGSDDFPMLFRLLESAVEAMGGEESLGNSELSRFILRHIFK